MKKILVFTVLLVVLFSQIIEATDNIGQEADAQMKDLLVMKEKLIELDDVMDISLIIENIEYTEYLLQDAKYYYDNENYEDAETVYEEALENIVDIRTAVNELVDDVPDYSSIIWTVAIVIVVLIIIITIIRYWKSRKEKKEEKEEEEADIIFYEPKDKRYRTEYY